MPIRARFALFGAGIVSVTVVVFAVIVYFLVQHSLTTQRDLALTRRGEQVWSEAQFHDTFSIPAPGPRGIFVPTELKSSTEIFTEVLDASGDPKFTTATLNGSAPAIPREVLNGVTISAPKLTTVDFQNLLVRTYIRRFRWVSPDSSFSGYVVAGQPMTGVAVQLAGLRWFLITGAVLSLVAAMGASWLLARRALRPLEVMATTAEEIGRTHDLSRRLPVGARKDEVGRLGQSFNRMLQQLQDSYLRLQAALEAQRRFVADASHELRTPLTTIRSNAGLIAQRADLRPEDRQEAVQDIVMESARMSRMVQDLLTLARADAGHHLDLEPVDLHPVIQDVCRQTRQLQPTRVVDFPEDGPAVVRGNADGLKQLVWILVDNAVKHTTDAGRIDLRLKRVDGVAEMRVGDDGVGIPPGDMDRIFERFYRANSSRAGEGAGLGLAIASWIVREHAGTLQASNNQWGGATFTVRLPLLENS